VSFELRFIILSISIFIREQNMMLLSVTLLSLTVPMVFGASGFDTSGCVDAAGTSSCIQTAVSSITSVCTTVCGCQDPFLCSGTSYDCLAGCVCEAYKASINCVLSHCWNKVRILFPNINREVKADPLSLSRYILASINSYL
jgi:hypothetical protein